MGGAAENKLFGYGPTMVAVLVTSGVILVVVLGGRVLGSPVPISTAVLIIAVAVSSFLGGLRGAAASVAIAVGFEWLSYKAPWVPGGYAEQNLLHVWLFTIVCPLIAGLVTTLKRQAEATARTSAVTTERQRAEAELRRERARLDAVLDHINLGIILVDENRKVLWGNPTAKELLGHAPEMFDEGMTERTFHEDRSPYPAAELPLARALAGKVVRQEDIIYLRGDGKMVGLRVNAAPARSPEGPIIGAAITFEDVTAQKQAEASREELDAVLRATDDAIYTVTPEGVVVSWNPGAEKLLGFAADEARYMKVVELLPAESYRRYEAALKALPSARGATSLDLDHVRKGGGPIPVAVRVSPVRGKWGEARAITMLIRERRL